MTVVVIGANGQLGTDVVAALQGVGEPVLGLNHTDLDISSLESTRNTLYSLRPSVVVNTAAMHHVEDCEKNPVRAHEVNALGARNLSIVTRDLGAKLLHVSTDYVFDGSKQNPYVETDAPSPLNVYGSTKLAGETYIKETAEKYFIVRTSALYGRNPCRAKGGRNFVELMLKLARERDELRVVNDEIVSPTSTSELARQIIELYRSDHYGLYHATAEGSCSWFQFAAAIFAITNTKVNLKVADPSDFPAKVPRPKYSVLENQELKKLGLNAFGSWQAGLTEYLTPSC
jgi:dTDP-4-dehydrorhamnose reductase